MLPRHEPISCLFQWPGTATPLHRGRHRQRRHRQDWYDDGRTPSLGAGTSATFDVAVGAATYGAVGAAARVGEAGAETVPTQIFRKGTPSPSNLRLRPGEEALSFRGSLSNSGN
jgi:hypothetical protein